MPIQWVTPTRIHPPVEFDEALKKRALEVSIRNLDLLKDVFALLKKLRPDIEDERKLSRDEIKLLSDDNPTIFAQRYLRKNIVKCSIAADLYSGRFKSVRKIVDLGIGPGTFLFPFALALKNNEFIGIDRSRAALELADTFFKIAKLAPPLLIRGNLPSAIVAGGQFFTASYLLTEFDDGELREFAEFMGHRQDAQFLVVDYPDVIKRLVGLISERRPSAARVVSMRLDEAMAERVGDDHIRFGAVYAPIAASRYRTISGQLGKA